MTEAMPFLQKAILLSYAPRPFRRGAFRMRPSQQEQGIQRRLTIMKFFFYGLSFLKVSGNKFRLIQCPE